MKDEDDRNLTGCFIAALVIGLWVGGVAFLVWTTITHVF
jgi:hypothetical protein